MEHAHSSTLRMHRNAVALETWKEWAKCNIGDVSDEPAPAELEAKSTHLKQLERNCAKLAKRAEERLKISEAIRSGQIGAASGPLSGRDAVVVARERGRNNMHKHVKEAGVAERKRPTSAPTYQSRAAAPSIAAAAGVYQPQSRGLLNSILGAESQQPPAKGVPGDERRRPAAGAEEDGKGARKGDATFAGSKAASKQQLQIELETLNRELEAVRAAQRQDQMQVQVQQDLEVQLRHTIELLQSRLLAVTQRDIVNERQLALSDKLRPIMAVLEDKLAYSNPLQVVERLQQLEGDQMGLLDQLVRAQEDVIRLQTALAESHRKTELVTTKAQVDHLEGAARLQAENEALRSELQSMKAGARRLQERQGQLVVLQNAVMDLYSNCMVDPRFQSATSSRQASRSASPERMAGAPASPGRLGTGELPGAESTARSGSPRKGGATALDWGTKSHDRLGGSRVPEPAGGLTSQGLVDCVFSEDAVLEVDDPLSMIQLIQEFVAQASPAMSSKRLKELQMLANKAWNRHFQERPEFKGNVLRTFETLSLLAEKLTAEKELTKMQLATQKGKERELVTKLKRTEISCKSLEVDVDRLQGTLRVAVGMPRKQRPQSAHVLRTASTLQPDLLLDLTRAKSGTASTHLLAASRTSPSALGLSKGPTRTRPQSAVVSRTKNIIGVEGNKSSSAMTSRTRPFSASAATRSAAPRGDVHISDGPPGLHWSSLIGHKNGMILPARGALFTAVATATAAASGKGADSIVAGSPGEAAAAQRLPGTSSMEAWNKLDRVAVEAKFLSGPSLSRRSSSTAIE